MRFRAAVLHEVGGRLQVEELEMADLHPSDVLVRIHASGLCHTDLEVVQGSLQTPLPIVLGHEGAGVVEAVGSEVKQVKPGAHVVCSWNPSCGHCFYCSRDLPILCEPYIRNNSRGFLMDDSSRLKHRNQIVHHHSFVSSHAEYCVVPEAGAVRVPQDMPLDRACLLGCGVMTGVGAVMNVAKVPEGASVAVFGCGAVGLNVIQGARLARATPIIALDPNSERLAMARTFGATDTFKPSDHDTVAHVRQLTAGRGADYAFEAAGNEKSMQQALEAARLGGKIVILGKVSVDSCISLRFGSLMGEKQITRSSYGGARPARDFPLLARHYLEGKLKLDELITQRLPLNEINRGFDSLRKGEGIRTVISVAN